MNKIILAGLLATTLTSPITSALAQDDNHPTRAQRGDNGPHGGQGGDHQRGGGGNPGGNGGQQQQAQPRAQAQPAPAQPAQVQARGQAPQAQVQARGQAPQAQAQQQGQRGGPAGQFNGNGGRPDNGRGYRGQAGAPPVAAQTPQVQVRPQEQWRGQQPNNRNDGRTNGYPNANRSYPGNQNWANRNDGRRLNDRDRWVDQRRWNNNWRNDNRYDWQRYRNANRSLFHAPRYYAPYGWNYGYQQFSIGFYLNDLLFSDQYWIDDPTYYRLPPAYGTLRWVRYYDDALLVDIRDGYVVDVIHDFFW